MVLVLALVLLVSVARGDDSSGVHVWITQSGVNVLRDYTLMFIESLQQEKIDINDEEKKDCSVKGITLHEFKADKNHATLTLKEGALRLVLGQVHLKMDINTEGKGCSKKETSPIKVTGTISGSLEAKVTSKEGKPEVKLTECKINEKPNIEGLGFFQRMKINFVSWFCNPLKKFISRHINSKLATLPTQYELSLLEHNFLLNYGLSAPPTVTPTHLQASVRGWFMKKDTPVDTVRTQLGPVPVPKWPQDQMVSIAVTDVFGHSVALALQQAGTFKIPDPNWLAKFLLWAFGLPSKNVEMTFREMSQIHITDHKLQITGDVQVRSNEQDRSAALTCDLTLNPVVEKCRVVLISPESQINCHLTNPDNPQAKPLSWSAAEWFISKIPQISRIPVNKIQSFFEVPVPLPEGLCIGKVTTEYYEGYLVVSGDLATAPPQQNPPPAQ